jgi:hypothetical protein
MGAKAVCERIELITDSNAFNNRVGLKKNYYDLEWLGLSGHDFCGIFRSRYLPQLIEFCNEHPQYHILTSCGPGRIVNRLVHDRHGYLIGDGDSDPNLVFNHTLSSEWHSLFEDGISSALAELDKIKSRR